MGYGWDEGILNNSQSFILTFSNFGDFLLDSWTVCLLLLRDGCPLLIKSQRAVLWQAVKLPFKLLLQLPEAGEESSEFTSLKIL